MHIRVTTFILKWSYVIWTITPSWAIKVALLLWIFNNYMEFQALEKRFILKSKTGFSTVLKYNNVFITIKKKRNAK